jgi:hypothetical protein
VFLFDRAVDGRIRRIGRLRAFGHIGSGRFTSL